MEQKRIEIIGASLVSSGGETLEQTWEFISKGYSSCKPLPEEFSCHVQSNRGHWITTFERNPYRLLALAEKAIEQLFDGLEDRVGSKQEIPSIGALCIGSTSSSFTEVERGVEVKPDYLGANLARKFEIPLWFQTSQACASSSHAIALGADLIRNGKVDTVLAGGVDELACCVMAAFEAVKLHCDECKPFDRDRQGLVLGEAAAFVLMAREGLGQPWCYLDGAGLTCDAWNSVAPLQRGISKAILDAIVDAQCEKIDFVVTHGTGTKLNDFVEATAIWDAMKDLNFPFPVISSYKGSLGHPQGASGAVGIALAIQALRTQSLFPTVGLNQTDPAIPLEVVKTSSTHLGTMLDEVLCLSYGSWGTNAAIVLSKREAR